MAPVHRHLYVAVGCGTDFACLKRLHAVAPQKGKQTIETLVTLLFRDRVQFCSGLVDLVVGVRHHRAGSHRLALSGKRFVGPVAEDIAKVGNCGV